MEKRKAAEDRRFAADVQAGGKLGDVCEDVSVRQRDAFRLAGGAGGEKQYRFIAVAAFVEAEYRCDDGRRQQFGEEGPFHDRLLELGHRALNEDQVAVRRPGEARYLADEGVCGDEAVDIGLAYGRADGVVGGGKIEVHRNFSGEENREVCDQPALAGWQHDGDSLLVGFLPDVFRKCDCDGEDFREGQDHIVRAVHKPVVWIILEAKQESGRERALENGAARVGFLECI